MAWRQPAPPPGEHDPHGRCAVPSGGPARYGPDGQRRDAAARLQPDQRVTGQTEDASLERSWYGTRAYDPVLGRFVPPDPVVPDPMDPQLLNRYSYVRNNPLPYTDPSGQRLGDGLDEGRGGDGSDGGDGSVLGPGADSEPLVAPGAPAGPEAGSDGDGAASGTPAGGEAGFTGSGGDAGGASDGDGGSPTGSAGGAMGDPQGDTPVMSAAPPAAPPTAPVANVGVSIDQVASAVAILEMTHDALEGFDMRASALGRALRT